MAADVREDLGAQAELADGLAVRARLLARGGRRELDVLDAERVERLGYCDLGLGVEESVSELLALCLFARIQRESFKTQWVCAYLAVYSR